MVKTIQFVKDFNTNEPHNLGIKRSDQPNVSSVETIYEQVSYPKGAVVRVQVFDDQSNHVFTDLTSQVRFTVPDNSFYIYV